MVHVSPQVAVPRVSSITGCHHRLLGNGWVPMITGTQHLAVGRLQMLQVNVHLQWLKAYQ